MSSGAVLFLIVSLSSDIHNGRPPHGAQLLLRKPNVVFHSASCQHLVLLQKFLKKSLQLLVHYQKKKKKSGQKGSNISKSTHFQHSEVGTNQEYVLNKDPLIIQAARCVIWPFESLTAVPGQEKKELNKTDLWEHAVRSMSDVLMFSTCCVSEHAFLHYSNWATWVTFIIHSFALKAPYCPDDGAL